MRTAPRPVVAIRRESAAGMVLAATLALVSTLTPAPARAAPGITPPPAIDVTPYAATLTAYHDGKGHTFVLPKDLMDLGKVQARLFYGDGKTFYRQPVDTMGRSVKDRSSSFSVFEPRVGGGAYSQLIARAGKLEFHCEDRATPLQPLAPASAAAMIKAARFHDQYWRRTPHLLARDNRGRYFYVDRLAPKPAYDGATDYRDAGFRVFSGLRGKLRPLKMKNVVSDASGEIFITLDGQLQLVFDRATDSKARAQWIARSRTTELTLVDTQAPASRKMIYRDLGVYAGQRLERPCDDL